MVAEGQDSEPPEPGDGEDTVPPVEPASKGKRWYLGIDLGTVGISAALMDSEAARSHSILWQGEDQTGNSISILRFPAIAYFAADQLSQEPEPPLAVGDRALQARASNQDQPGLLLTHLRHSLGITLPYLSARRGWEPVLQWSDQQSLPLAWVQQAVTALLTTLKIPSNCIAQDLSPDEFEAAIADLAGVVLGCPTDWSDTYRFNLREAVLAAGLVAQPEQIFWVEDAIASLLLELPATPPASSQPSQRTGSDLLSRDLSGKTLVLNAGASFTELLLVDLPADPQTLNRDHLVLRSVLYAGNAIDQDIICQLLYPSVWGWRNLGSPSLDLPLPGEPDLPTRYQFQQRLRSNDLGQQLIRIAKQLKLAFQQQDTATFDFNQQPWTVTQQDFNSRVIAPYLQLINREINLLLAHAGIVGRDVRQVLCSGGTASNPAIAHWLKQKFPNATLVQDQVQSKEFSTRIASGLAKLPFYPQLLDAARHQYSDYFLLRELLETLPNEPLPFQRILQLLEAQGINTQACQNAIFNLLEGQLPAGLFPSKTDSVLLTADSQQSPEYRRLLRSPVFSRPSSQVYQVNSSLADDLWQHLDTILAHTHQTLKAPLPLNLGVETAV